MRERILESAFKLYTTKPPYDVTVEEIAKEAGVSKSLIFYYFKNKDSLIEETAYYGFKKMFGGEIRSVEELIDLSFQILDERKSEIGFFIYTMEKIVRSKRFDRFRELFVDIMNDLIAPLFVKEGFKDSEKVAIVICAMLDGLSLYHYFYNFEDLESYKKLILEIVECKKLKEVEI